MKEKRLLKAMGGVDGKYIEESSPIQQRKKSTWLKWGVMAACLSLAVIAFPVYKMLNLTTPASHSYVIAGNDAWDIQDMTTTDTGNSDAAVNSGVADAAPMVYVNDTLFKQTTQTWYDEMKAEFVYLGKVESDVTNDQSSTDGTPKANFQANHPIVGCEIYQYGENVVILNNEKYWLYERYDLNHELPSVGQELPGGAYIGNENGADATVQEEGALAYENLMGYFVENYGEDNYPDWYGGSYLESNGHLTINVVLSEANGADDKELYIQIMEWAGSQQVVFSDVKYSLMFLRNLQKQVESLPELKLISSWECSVNVESGQVELTIPQADEALLVALAKLDPEDDAILVQVCEAYSIATDAAGGEAFSDLDGNPVGYGISDLPEKLPETEKKLTGTGDEE